MGDYASTNYPPVSGIDLMLLLSEGVIPSITNTTYGPTFVKQSLQNEGAIPQGAQYLLIKEYASSHVRDPEHDLRRSCEVRGIRLSGTKN